MGIVRGGVVRVVNVTSGASVGGRGVSGVWEWERGEGGRWEGRGREVLPIG